MSTPHAWPTRSSICLDCRTALPAAAECPHGAHRTASLRDARGREALLATVWGPKPLRTQLREATRAGAVGGTGSSVFNGCSAIDAGTTELALVLVVGFVVVGACWLLGGLIARLLRGRRQRLQARGAQRALPAPRSAGRLGTVVARGELVEPLHGQRCVAFGVTLTHARRQTMLRDGATLGFDVALDSGERVQIPAGIIAIDPAKTSQPIGAPRLTNYLTALDPAHAGRDDLDPFLSDDARLTIVQHGDRVELLSPVVSVANPASAPATYREAPPPLLVPDGAVRLRPVA